MKVRNNLWTRPVCLLLLFICLFSCLTGCGATVVPAETGGGTLKESETEETVSAIAELEGRAAGPMHYADFFRDSDCR